MTGCEPGRALRINRKGIEKGIHYRSSLMTQLKKSAG